MKQETINEVLKFRDERNWKQFHNPKDLAISISLEAAELLEIFQWSADDVWCKDKMEKIREELADVLNYCILMADTCGLDMDEIIQEKVRKNGEKYPVEKAYGHKEKYTELGKVDITMGETRANMTWDENKIATVSEYDFLLKDNSLEL